MGAITFYYAEGSNRPISNVGSGSDGSHIGGVVCSRLNLRAIGGGDPEGLGHIDIWVRGAEKGMIWKNPVSWSRWKTALDCPRQLELTLERKPASEPRQTYYTLRGHLVQLVYTLYFNQKVNLRDKCRTPEALTRITDAVLQSPLMTRTVISYPKGKTEQDLRDTVHSQVQNGLLVLRSMGLLTKVMISEISINGKISNLAARGRLDFLREDGNFVEVYDGKGNAEDDADPRQIMFYALMLISNGKKVRRGGFLYWQRHYKEVDLSLPRLKQFLEELRETAELFHSLRKGIGGPLKAIPGKPCYFCNWKRSCEVSKYFVPAIAKELSGELSFE